MFGSRMTVDHVSVIPAQAGIHPGPQPRAGGILEWMPAFAGMTDRLANWLVMALVSCVLNGSAAMAADPKAVRGTFIGEGVYATADGCKKLEALKAGADRNVSTVPETLSEDGFEGWEGSCTFSSITETVPGKTWKARMWCGEGADEGPESDVFERTADGKLKVTVMGNTMDYALCDAAAGK